MGDRIFGGIGIVFAIFYMWQASLVQKSFLSDLVGPKVFPLILGVLLAGTSLVIILRPDADVIWPKGRPLLEVLLAIAVMFAYAQFLPDVGFLVATALASAWLTWRLGTMPLGSLIAGCLIAVAIYVVFKKILGLSLAKGPLDFYVDFAWSPVEWLFSTIGQWFVPAEGG